MGGTAAGVLPDNMLCMDDAGATTRRLLQDCDVHALFRLPTNILYTQGVKATILFFEKRTVTEPTHIRTLWVCDLRTNQHFTPKSYPLMRAHIQNFVACCGASNQRAQQRETERFPRYERAQLLARDKVNFYVS
jgi:type I restriction enzyme M protein